MIVYIPGIPIELALPCDAVSSLMMLTPPALPTLESLLDPSPPPFSPIDGTLIGGRGWFPFMGGDPIRCPGMMARAPSLLVLPWILNPELFRLLCGVPALPGLPLPMYGVLLGVRLPSFSVPNIRYNQKIGCVSVT